MEGIVVGAVQHGGRPIAAAGETVAAFRGLKYGNAKAGCMAEPSNDM